MAFLYFSGAETGDVREILDPGVAGITADTSVVKTGGYSYKAPASVTPQGGFFIGTLNTSTFYARCHLRVDFTGNPSAPTYYALVFTERVSTFSGISFIFAQIDQAGVLSLNLYNNITDTFIGSSFVITKGVWYTVELKTVISATVGILELRVNGVVVATGSNLNTGTNNVGDFGMLCMYPAFVVNLNGLTGGVLYIDDVIISDSAYPGEGACIARQGKAGSPTYNAFTKNGAATAALCWSDTPFATGTNCTSIIAADAQTMLTESFATIQSGHGNEVLGSGYSINACKAAMIGKVAVATSHSIRRRIAGANTDTAKSITTSDAYYDDGIWTAALGDLNAAEIGVLHGAGVNLLTIEDMWLMVDYAQSFNNVVMIPGD